MASGASPCECVLFSVAVLESRLSRHMRVEEMWISVWEVTFPKGVSLFCSIKHLTGTLAPCGGAILAGKEGAAASGAHSLGESWWKANPF